MMLVSDPRESADDANSNRDTSDDAHRDNRLLV